MSRLVLSPDEYRHLCSAVLNRDKWKCRVCKKRQELTAHHIIYRSHGGDDAFWNLITLCSTCHDGVHRKNAATGGCLVIKPLVEGQRIDANGVVVFQFVSGWKP